jgi:hypothetical protein
MSTALALPSSATSRCGRAITGAHWGRLNDKQRAKFRLLEQAMQALCKAPARGLTKAYHEQAQWLEGMGLRVGVDRVKKYFEAWRSNAPDGGDYALVDHRLCKGCGLPGCHKAAQRSLLHPLTVDAWIDLATDNKAIQRKGTMVLRDAWRRLIIALCEGQVIAGIADGLPGTWQSLHGRLYPTKPAGPKCPWSESNPPPGYSYKNFLARKPEKKLIYAAQRGVAQLLKDLPEARQDYSRARLMEFVMIDDHRIDVMVWGEWAGKVQLVELWALFIMDVATRRILWVQLHPRYQDETGNAVGIRARDVQHAFAHMFATYGVPLDYPCTIKCENATAVITKSCADIIKRAFDGRVLVDWSGTFDKKLLMTGFSERGGSPNGKAVLESFFGRRFDLAFGAEKGQIGSRYDLKPGQLERQLQHVNRVIAKVGNVATEDELSRVIVDFHSMQTVRPAILAALQHIETNPHHELQGFERVMEWRFSDYDPEWKTVGHPAMTLMHQQHGLDYVNAFLAQPGTTRSRMETVREKWQRLFIAEAFARPSPEALFEMLVDEFPAKYRGGDVLAVDFGKRGGGEHEFFGSRHHLRPDQKVVCRLDLEFPQAGVWLFSESGVRLGYMQYRARTAYGDEDGLVDQLKMKAKAEQSMLKSIRRVKENRDDLQAEIAARQARIDTLQTLDTRAANLLQPSPGNQRFVDAITDEDADFALPEEPAKSGGITDFYLNLHKPKTQR